MQLQSLRPSWQHHLRMRPAELKDSSYAPVNWTEKVRARMGPAAVSESGPDPQHSHGHLHSASQIQSTPRGCPSEQAKAVVTYAHCQNPEKQQQLHVALKGDLTNQLCMDFNKLSPPAPPGRSCVMMTKWQTKLRENKNPKTFKTHPTPCPKEKTLSLACQQFIWTSLKFVCTSHFRTMTTEMNPKPAAVSGTTCWR